MDKMTFEKSHRLYIYEEKTPTPIGYVEYTINTDSIVTRRVRTAPYHTKLIEEAAKIRHMKHSEMGNVKKILPIIRIESIYVNPDQRNKGVGTAIIEGLFNKITKKYGPVVIVATPYIHINQVNEYNGKMTQSEAQNILNGITTFFNKNGFKTISYKVGEEENAVFSHYIFASERLMNIIENAMGVISNTRIITNEMPMSPFIVPDEKPSADGTTSNSTDADENK